MTEILEQHQVRAREVAESDPNPFAPSADLAYFFGLVSGRGTVSPKQGIIEVKGRLDDPYFDLFKIAADTALHLDLKTYNTGDGTIYARLHSKTSANHIGSLSSRNWHQTLMEKAPWIIEPNYGTDFLRGRFDSNSSIKRNHIVLRAGEKEAAELIYKLLAQVGVPSSLTYNKYQRTYGVCVYKRTNHRLFYERVSPKHPRKIEDLENMIGNISNPANKSDLIKEWMQMQHILQKTPTLHDIRRLKKEGKTPYSEKVYMRNFGNGNFSSAQQELADLQQHLGDISNRIPTESTKNDSSAQANPQPGPRKTQLPNETAPLPQIEYPSIQELYKQHPLFRKYNQWIQDNMDLIRLDDESLIHIHAYITNLYKKALSSSWENQPTVIEEFTTTLETAIEIQKETEIFLRKEVNRLNKEGYSMGGNQRKLGISQRAIIRLRS